MDLNYKTMLKSGFILLPPIKESNRLLLLLHTLLYWTSENTSFAEVTTTYIQPQLSCSCISASETDTTDHLSPLHVDFTVSKCVLTSHNFHDRIRNKIKDTRVHAAQCWPSHHPTASPKGCEPPDGFELCISLT